MIEINIFFNKNLHKNFLDSRLKYFPFPLPTIVEGLK